MRWKAQTIDGEADAALPGLRMPGLVRSVRTPEFAGVTFHEVRARSVLNEVPASSGVPFRWTVNPYRGCTHACVYCLGGETPILLASGRTKPLAEVEVGDAVVGTVRSGALRRRYIRTEVLAHWQTTKPGYQVVLQDGTTLVASADHRFLTTRGWREVRELVLSDQLLGSGRLRRLPRHTRALPVENAVVSSDPSLRVVSVHPLEADVPMYDITTGTGDFVADGVVSHNCFARNSHSWLDLDTGLGFDTEIVVKVNAPEVLARELRRPSWPREHVALGTNTDPYQRAEGRYRLMPGIIEALAGSGTPFSVLTKGTLLRRDLPLLAEAAGSVRVGLAVSLAIHDESLHDALEPGTPSPRARLGLVRSIRAAGFDCAVLLAPVLPWLTDSTEQLSAALAEIAAAGATSVTPIPLHLRRGAREWFMAWLQRERPDLLPGYRRLYGRGAYVSSAYKDRLYARLGPLLAEHGLDGGARGASRGLRSDDDVAPGPAAARTPENGGGDSDGPGEQLALI